MSPFQWIEGFQLVRLIVTMPGLYPALSALHILGIGVLLGSIAVVDLRLLGIFDARFDPVLKDLVRLALSGFAVAAAAGVLIASVRIGSYAQNPAFLAKLILVIAAGANALALRIAARAGDISHLAGRPGGRAAAALSLCLWLGAVFAGRWIAFV